MAAPRKARTAPTATATTEEATVPTTDPTTDAPTVEPTDVPTVEEATPEATEEATSDALAIVEATDTEEDDDVEVVEDDDVEVLEDAVRVLTVEEIRAILRRIHTWFITLALGGTDEAGNTPARLAWRGAPGARIPIGAMIAATRHGWTCRLKSWPMVWHVTADQLCADAAIMLELSPYYSELTDRYAVRDIGHDVMQKAILAAIESDDPVASLVKSFAPKETKTSLGKEESKLITSIMGLPAGQADIRALMVAKLTSKGVTELARREKKAAERKTTRKP